MAGLVWRGVAAALILVSAAGCATQGPKPPGSANIAPPAVAPAAAPECQALDAQIRATYTFKPSRLTPADQDAKAALMDDLWKQVQGDPIRLAPCLRRALGEPGADPFFLFDGSALLVAVDPGIESKTLQTRLWTHTALEDVELRLWVQVLAQRGYEGFDVTEAGQRWLADPTRHYALPDDGGTVDAQLGALFLFGSLDEERATPALARIAVDGKQPGRLIAIWLMVFQLTPAAIQALRTTDVSAMPSEARAAIQALLADATPPTRQPTPPATTGSPQARERWLQAFDALLEGDAAPLGAMRASEASGSSTTDTTVRTWASGLPAVLKADDLPLLRRVRRCFARMATPSAADDYIALSTAIGALIRR
ncbi:MAG TPA: hypothetical protein VNO55_14895 [Polyangia bacterium]|nr:hypothetical protein [Polyangia bacterium]